MNFPRKIVIGAGLYILASLILAVIGLNSAGSILQRQAAKLEIVMDALGAARITAEEMAGWEPVKRGLAEANEKAERDYRAVRVLWLGGWAGLTMIATGWFALLWRRSLRETSEQRRMDSVVADIASEVHGIRDISQKMLSVLEKAQQKTPSARVSAAEAVAGAREAAAASAAKAAAQAAEVSPATLDRAHDAASIDDEPTADDPALHGRTVLIAGGDIRCAFAMTAMLEKGRMKVIYCESGKEAIQQLNSQPDIDLVLMDSAMPEMDGLAAIRRIRSQPEHAGLPIVAILDEESVADRQQCLAAGASECIVRPARPQPMLPVVRRWLSNP